MKFSVEEMFDIARALVADDQRFNNLSDEHRVKLCLVALNDYVDGMTCGKCLTGIDLAKIEDPKERTTSIAMECLYLELRYRATRQHDEQLADKYLKRHNQLLKRIFRSFKKEELNIFLEAISSW